MDLQTVVIGVAAFLAAFYFKEMSSVLKDAVSSIKELNGKVAVIIERTETHGYEISLLREKHEAIKEDVAHIKATLDKVKGS